MTHSTVFVCPFPPPLTGQAVASETFFELLRPLVPVEHVPIRGPVLAAGGQAGRTERVRAHVDALRALRRRLADAPGATVYFCPSGSAFGLLRDLALVAAARGRAGRIVGHIHSGNYDVHWEHPVQAELARRLATAVDAFLVPTETQAARVRRVMPDTPVHVVTNVVTGDVRLSDAAVEAAWARRKAPGPLRVLYLSNFYRTKGYRDVLDAVAAAQAPVEATFVGTWPLGEDADAFLDRARQLGVAARVAVRPPAVSRAAVRDLFAAADVVALPTQYPQEAQPLAVLEGMANGCAIVATPHASIPEYVHDGRTGLLVPPRDVAALAAALDRLADRAELVRIGRKARAMANLAFSPHVALPPLLDALGYDRAILTP